MTLRQILNLFLPPLMWLCSSVGFFIESARDPAEMSNANPSLLVPSGIAFSIWLPIFVLCIAYGITQAKPSNKDNPVLRQIGCWTAAGFIGVCLWGLVNAFWPDASVQMATAIVFIPTMLLLVAAMFKFRVAREEHQVKFPFAYAGVSMIAGWCSIAVFLNWTPQIVTAMSGFGLTASVTSTVILGLALVWIAIVAQKSGGNIFYIIPPVWGLFWLTVLRVGSEPMHTNIIAMAVAGIILLSLIGFLGFRRQAS